MFCSFPAQNQHQILLQSLLFIRKPLPPQLVYLSFQQIPNQLISRCSISRILLPTMKNVCL